MQIWYKISPEKTSETKGLLRELAKIAPNLTDRVLKNMGSHVKGSPQEETHILHIQYKYLEDVKAMLTDATFVKKYGISGSGLVIDEWMKPWLQIGNLLNDD